MSDTPKEDPFLKQDRRSFWRTNFLKQIERGQPPSIAAWYADGALDHFDKRVADGKL